MPTKARGLGRGLEALLPPRAGEISALLTIPVEKIAPAKDQPRKSFDPDKLEELAQSIREHGVLEPLLVRRTGDDAYEITAGERRWRAAQRAGLREVPCLLRNDAPPVERAIALIENLQREDLNSIDVAEGVHHLIEDFGYSQEMAAKTIGLSQGHVSEILRLLKLPEPVREAVRSGKVPTARANVLLKAKNGEQLAELTKKVLNGASRRELRNIVSPKRRGPRVPPVVNPNLRDLELRMERKAGVKVKVESFGNNGIRVTLCCGNFAEADMVFNRIFPEDQ